MNWTEIIAIVSGAIAVALGVERIAQHWMRGKYATSNEMLGLERAVHDENEELRERVIRLEEQIKALPGHITIERIYKSQADSKDETAKLAQRVEGMSVDLKHLATAITEMRDDIRRKE